MANCCADCGARVLELDPDCADALLGLAIIKFGSKDTQEVRDLCSSPLLPALLSSQQPSSGSKESFC